MDESDILVTTIGVRCLAEHQVNSDVLFDMWEHPELQGQWATFVVPAGVMLNSVPHSEGQDCFLITAVDMHVSQLEDGLHDLSAGVTTLWNGNNYPYLLLSDGSVGIDAEVVLDAHVDVEEQLLFVFDCKDGFVLFRAPFTNRLEAELKTMIAVRDHLPRSPVGLDGVCPTRNPFPVRKTAHFGF